MTVTAATPRILPPITSPAEAEANSTSRIRLDFSSITLLRRMPALVKIIIQSRKPSAKPMIPGSRSFRPACLPWLAAYSTTLGAAALAASMSEAFTPRAASRWEAMRLATAWRTSSSRPLSERFRLQKSTTTSPRPDAWITAATSRRAGFPPDGRTSRGLSFRPASAASETGPAGEGTMIARGPEPPPRRERCGVASARAISAA